MWGWYDVLTFITIVVIAALWASFGHYVQRTCVKWWHRYEDRRKGSRPTILRLPLAYRLRNGL